MFTKTELTVKLRQKNTCGQKLVCYFHMYIKLIRSSIQVVRKGVNCYNMSFQIITTTTMEAIIRTQTPHTLRKA